MFRAEVDQRLSQLAPRRDGAPAIEHAGEPLDHATLASAVSTCAAVLARRGVAPGDPVVVACANGPAHVVSTLAVMCMGAVAVPVAGDVPGARLERVVHVTGARVRVVDGADPPAGSRDVGLPGGAIRVVADEGTQRADGTPPRAPDGVALVRFSSGTTGEPKGAMLRFDQVVGMARLLSDRYVLGEEHRELLLAPMAYSGAWQRVAATIHGGGCVVIPRGAPIAQAVLEALPAHAVTGFFTPPPLLRLMLSLPETRVRPALAGCRSIEIGSAPLAAAELARLVELAPGARVFFHYGLTECSRAFILDASACPDRLDTVGRAAAGVEAQICDARGLPLGPGDPGEIRLRAPQCAIGYWGAPAASDDGWLATGDHGTLDEDGFLRVHGRADDRICCGGHSFYPVEAEQALGAIDGVGAYLLAGAPDDVLGEVAWAFVVPAAGWSRAAFTRAARSRLPAHMRPRRVVEVDALPVTGSGKPDRRGAIERYGGDGSR